MLCVDEKSQILDREVPAHLDVHLVFDNSSTHKTPVIQRWLAATRACLALHTDECVVAERRRALVCRAHQQKLLRRGAHRSVNALNADIRTWIDTWNDNPQPFVWTKTADQILDSIGRYCQRINQSVH